MNEQDGQNFAGVIVVIILVALVFLLGHWLLGGLKTERCLSEGRHNCTDIPQPDPDAR